MILVQELSREPHLKKQVRDVFKESALVSVKPTEKGLSRIDETHPYNVGDPPFITNFRPFARSL